MIPKEKAEELVSKMSTQTYKIQPYAGANYTIEEIGFEGGKKCALIAVDEILELTKRNTYNPFDWNEITGIRYDKFWTEVKQEIEKL
jgi:hypothetical protein